MVENKNYRDKIWIWDNAEILLGSVCNMYGVYLLVGEPR